MSEQKAEKTPGEVTKEIVRRLHNVKAQDWTIQEKGVLLAAVKLQLSGRGERV